jgi:hypothetical protein
MPARHFFCPTVFAWLSALMAIICLAEKSGVMASEAIIYAAPGPCAPAPGVAITRASLYSATNFTHLQTNTDNLTVIVIDATCGVNTDVSLDTGIVGLCINNRSSVPFAGFLIPSSVVKEVRFIPSHHRSGEVGFAPDVPERCLAPRFSVYARRGERLAFGRTVAFQVPVAAGDFGGVSCKSKGKGWGCHRIRPTSHYPLLRSLFKASTTNLPLSSMLPDSKPVAMTLPLAVFRLGDNLVTIIPAGTSRVLLEVVPADPFDSGGAGESSTRDEQLPQDGENYVYPTASISAEVVRFALPNPSWLEDSIVLSFLHVIPRGVEVLLETMAGTPVYRPPRSAGYIYCQTVSVRRMWDCIADNDASGFPDATGAIFVNAISQLGNSVGFTRADVREFHRRGFVLGRTNTIQKNDANMLARRLASLTDPLVKNKGVRLFFNFLGV